MMRGSVRAAARLALSAVVWPAFLPAAIAAGGQVYFPLPDGEYAEGVVQMCLDAAGQAVPGCTFDSGPGWVEGTPANSSHAAGTVVGPTGSGNQSGLFVVPIARVPGGSGLVTSFGYKSTGGDNTPKLIRAWTVLPANTTCKDNAAFVANDTDDRYRIPGTPFYTVPSAPLITQGDSATYADQTGLTWDYRNLDGTPTENVYICVINGSLPDALDAGNLMRLTLAGPQN